jgi:L-ascorbate oxidase
MALKPGLALRAKMANNNPYGPLAVQLLICCALMLAFAHQVAVADAAPVTRRFKWKVEYVMWAPDCQQSVMIGINGKFPGPTITGNAGDVISVEVTNSLDTEGIVIHWHGIKQVCT